MWLVTGATGHIGNVLVRQLLERGQPARVLIPRGESRAPLSGLDVEAVEGDVLVSDSLRAALRGVRGVFHLAGLISIMPGRDPLVRRINVEGTRNMLDAAREAGIEKFIYTSSIHAMQRSDEGVIDESLPYDPHNPYGEYDRSKAEATLHVQQAAQAGLEAVIACPTGVIGPFDFRGSLMGDVIRTAALQKPTLYIDGAYDFVDVRDVAGGLIAAAERGRRGESYILSGERMTMTRLLGVVREVTGRDFFRMIVPYPAARFVARFMPLYYRLMRIPPRFTPYSLEVLYSNSTISHAKAARDLGYRPRPLKASIADAVRWYLEANQPQFNGIAVH